MKRRMENSRRWVLGSAALAVLAWVIFANLGPSEIVGPEPEGGFDETPADYDVPQYPEAPMVSVPVFNPGDLTAVPFPISFPEMKAGRDIALVGEIVHPNTAVTGALVRVGFYQPPRRGESEGRRRGGMQGFAKGEGGRLAYRIEGRTPNRPGTYDVRLEVRHLILDEDVDQLPVEERTTTTLIAEGRIVITN